MDDLSGRLPPGLVSDAACDTPPLTAAGADWRARLQQVFAPLETAKGILLAVSGGPDSTALMLMAAEWAQSQTRPPLSVATVDHGLRSGARAEAEAVAAWAAALGLPHKILTWEGEKPKARIQELARAARYDLLCAHAADIGADCLVTAHHADDQAETILFRLLRGSGLKGLSGMRPVAPRGGLFHHRPLLDWTKADLVGVCKALGHPSFDDPSNHNPAYARARLRRLSDVLNENGLDRAALLRLGARLARAEEALRARAETVAAASPNLALPPGFEADISPLCGEPDEIALRVIGILIDRARQAYGLSAPLRLDRLESAAVRIQAALACNMPFKASLGGMTLNLDLKAHLSIRPEALRRRGRIKPV